MLNDAGVEMRHNAYVCAGDVMCVCVQMNCKKEEFGGTRLGGRGIYVEEAMVVLARSDSDFADRKAQGRYACKRVGKEPTESGVKTFLFGMGIILPGRNNNLVAKISLGRLPSRISHFFESLIGCSHHYKYRLSLARAHPFFFFLFKARLDLKIRPNYITHFLFPL